ncbi:cobalamin-dependent protein [bacterium]|nr:cobalamin-dependent protein [bacterium]MDB4234864.1 cobalamin-dependent protein [bacterium]
MTDRDSGQSLFHDGLYREAVKEIGTLKEKLPDDVFAALAREVIKRLSDHPAAVSDSVVFPSEAKIDELARALIEPGAEAGIAFIDRVRERGASVETVYLAYLAEAARTLGNWWEDDLVSFAEVTAATGHIYAIMRGLKPMFRPTIATPSQPSAFFTAVPGETHLLGVSMAADLFRKQGWDIALKRDMDHDEIVQYAVSSGAPFVGLSAGGEHGLAPLARLIVALRISAPNAAIMVSGAIFETSYNDVKALGVDILPTSMDDAIEQAHNIWTQTFKHAQVS